MPVPAWRAGRRLDLADRSCSPSHAAACPWRPRSPAAGAPPLDVLVARKLGVPHQPELGLGALAEGGVRVSTRIWSPAGSPWRRGDRGGGGPGALELERRVRAYRGDRSLPSLAGRSVVVVDDGVATGGSAEAALLAGGPCVGRLVLAVPTCAPEVVDRLGAIADDVVAVITPASLTTVGQWYRDFTQTSDREVAELLAAAAPPRAVRIDPAAEEAEQLRLLVGAGRRVDLGSEGAGGPEHLVHRPQRLEHRVHVLRREPLVLAGGAGEVPPVDHQITAEELVDALLEGRRTEEPLVGQRGGLGVVEGGLQPIADVGERLPLGSSSTEGPPLGAGRSTNPKNMDGVSTRCRRRSRAVQSSHGVAFDQASSGTAEMRAAMSPASRR